MGAPILVVDDEPSLRQVLEIALRRGGYEVKTVSGVAAASRAIGDAKVPFPLVLTDLVMPDGSGMDVLAAARARSSDTQVIVMTAYSTVESALDAMRSGAYDFVTKPFSPAEIVTLASKALEKNAVVEENRRLKAKLAALAPTADEVFGHNETMRKVGLLVEKAAASKATVLLTGESGTGKERVARILHERSDRRAGPFCVINCGALPEALMESELFGHEKGAFTGATSATTGLFRQAQGGTLLLDEVGELPLPLQVKLLRVLQEKRVRPVGSSSEVPVDVRVLAATNRDVEAEVTAGRFRTDLYYRLNVLRVELPPLRERAGDARRLAQQMVARFAGEVGKPIEGLTPAALRALDGYAFPGNVRELENMMERAVALASGSWLDVDLLPDALVRRAATPSTGLLLPPEGLALDDVLADVERRLIQQALERTGGVRKRAAKLLGISFRSIRYRLDKLGVATDDADPTEESEDTIDES
ncbi:MAG: sigma-54-dependent Fis family transcriptional regulator [Deltaproteobacteria bacterium]|nr:sigma-54-dependent Fis family transcriptional regulator [Deltaproteobacteria bacterium]